MVVGITAAFNVKGKKNYYYVDLLTSLFGLIPQHKYLSANQDFLPLILFNTNMSSNTVQNIVNNQLIEQDKSTDSLNISVEEDEAGLQSTLQCLQRERGSVRSCSSQIYISLK